MFYNYVVTKAGFKIDGKTNNDVLLAGGGTIQLAALAMSTALNNLVPYTGAVSDVNLNAKNLNNVANIYTTQLSATSIDAEFINSTDSITAHNDIYINSPNALGLFVDQTKLKPWIGHRLFNVVKGSQDFKFVEFDINTMHATFGNDAWNLKFKPDSLTAGGDLVLMLDAATGLVKKKLLTDFANNTDTKFVKNFVIADFVLSGNYHILDVIHNLNNVDIITQIWDTTSGQKQVLTDDVIVLDANTVRIVLTSTQDLRFNGKIVIIKQ
jgi:hypothetical protein